jgi:nucleotide-binding universal stress UspA family protein
VAGLRFGMKTGLGKAVRVVVVADTAPRAGRYIAVVLSLAEHILAAAAVVIGSHHSSFVARHTSREEQRFQCSSFHQYDCLAELTVC